MNTEANSNPSETGREARKVVRQRLKAALATVDVETGVPYASLVTVASRMDATPIMLLSDLARHTGNLNTNPSASILFDATAENGDPLEGARVTLIGSIEKSDVEADSQRFLARHRNAAGYAGFADFGFYCLTVRAAHFIGGFGKIDTIADTEYLIDDGQASAFAAAEGDILDHMNADHGDAVSLYAEKLLGEEDGPWQMVGVDPEGCDLYEGGKLRRLTFETALDAPGQVRDVLVALARTARETG